MHAHKFKVGQKLVFTPGLHEFQQAPGLFEVARLLPLEGAEFQYRVRNVGSGQERVVRESQLQRP